MSAEIRPWSRIWLLVLYAIAWTFLIAGFVLVAKSVFEITRVQQVTTNSLSWSSAGLLLLLIGSLTNSCRKEFKLHSASPG